MPVPPDVTPSVPEMTGVVVCVATERPDSVVETFVTVPTPAPPAV